MRDLKREHGYSLEEQEGMLPFERGILLDMIHGEALAKANRPAQGWTKYAEELGATRKTGGYQDKFTVVKS